MGICCSKTKAESSSSSLSDQIINDPPYSKPQDLNESAVIVKKTETEQQEIENKTVLTTDEEENPGKKINEEEEDKLKKVEEIMSMHRKSYERSKTSDKQVEIEEKSSEDEKLKGNLNQNGAVRTSSCSREELDAILIQCGRLSRSNSPATKLTRRYSGSKRSFDFDQNQKSNDVEDANTTPDLEEEENVRRAHRTRHRQNESPRERRRRTPSREREATKNQRSGSRERGNGGSSSRRVSRSPGKRSENNLSSGGGGGSGSNVNSGNNRGGNLGGGSIVNSGNIRPTKKMVSVPATDKSDRNVLEPVNRNTASPRSQSPARGSNNNRPPATLSRSSSRKGEQSPHRRNPLEEIDPNSLAYPQLNAIKTGSGSANANGIKKTAESVGQKANSGSNNNNRMAPSSTICRAASPNRPTRQHQEVAEEPKLLSTDEEFPKPQSLTRSRSARKSRDFDANQELLSSNKNNEVAPSSYTALLLEDIQNFHQKTANVPITVPQCVTKARSILEAVADLNSTTNTPSPLPNDNQKNDLMEPSFEKYVTVMRGYSMEDMEEQESSGSNSVTGSCSSGLNRHHWGNSSSSWEPNSADSTDRWSSRTKNVDERDRSPLGFQRNDTNLKIQFDPLQNGIGQGRVGSGKSVQTTMIPQHVAAAAAASM